MQTDNTLANCRALITGASGGIGRATAAALAKKGARLALHGNSNSEKLDSLLAKLPGDQHIALTADLARPDECRRLISETVAGIGGLDLLVNNAGVFFDHPPLTTDNADWQQSWQQTLAVNLLAPAILCHAAAVIMAQNGGGKIINISSRGAFRGEPNAPAYGASKAGLNSMSQSLAQALAASNIMVYAIAPGFVETGMASALLDGPGGDAIRAQSPLGRAAKPAEIAATIAFLAGPDTDYLTGTIIDINGASYLRN
ncbi:MAG: SDR family oxidoreductase [Proteobacteria bacterium]|nr:SDR family oxidoreductase [Pseudomonadota bacterium]